ncbi:glycoprotein-N-acetylgalactosamine 3-beta-galactosyltransferase 1-like [Contarinia nasturtii]|uniref:glycoprotein-N-acetylgalactosamine 3-beta-galactosyltransferase 1-like n=1 Tax=Contarinia nasturtii TaxID=265458 RepID=UPI0012D3A7EA|nr:glycoprotein-N-acetylgalactosamine 3-beta-galactosyltransferase 1-like [Contarinia nasturtii]
MFAASPNTRETWLKVFALICGIFIGCLYASFGRSAAKSWFGSSNTQFTTVEPITEKPEINETAQFLVSDDTTIANALAQKVRVLCWVHNNNPEKEQIDAIQKTWGVRCTKFIVIKKSGGNSTDSFNIPNDRNSSSNIENAYRFIFDNYATKFDWFLKTTGSSYVVMENLRYKLFPYNPTDAIGIGLALKNGKYNLSYLSEKAGYVLSTKALEMLIKAFDKQGDISLAEEIHNDELRIAMFLDFVEVPFAANNDTDDKQLFFDKHLDEFFLPNPNVTFPYPWYQDYKVNHYLDHASNYSIAFCDISWQHMFVMEFLIYQLRPYGLETKHPPLPELNQH